MLEASFNRLSNKIEVVWLTNSWYEALKYASKLGFNRYPYCLVKYDYKKDLASYSLKHGFRHYLKG